MNRRICKDTDFLEVRLFSAEKLRDGRKERRIFIGEE